MAVTITLKNIPEDIYERLKLAAEAHRRSLNSEAIACFERVLMPTALSPEDHADRARQIRQSLGRRRYSAADIAKAVRRGRP